MTPGQRVKIVAKFPEESEIEGMTGTVIRVEDSSVDVFLDDDKYPTTFLRNEVEVIL